MGLDDRNYFFLHIYTYLIFTYLYNHTFNYISFHELMWIDACGVVLVLFPAHEKNISGVARLIPTASELRLAGWTRVDKNYNSCVPVRAACRKSGW